MHKPLPDLTGQRFGTWAVLRYTGRNRHKQRHYLCQCVCGKEQYITATRLYTKQTRSCLSCQIKTRKKHGLINTPLYAVWGNMRGRCLIPTHPCYSSYGGRGIKICAEWGRVENFVHWAKANGYRSGLTLDRRDNDGSYTSENCRWITQKEQMRNRRNTRWVTIEGVTKAASAWAEDIGVHSNVIYARLNKGISGTALLQRS